MFLSITTPSVIASEDPEDPEDPTIPIPITIKQPDDNVSALATTSASAQPAMYGYMHTENSLRYNVEKVRVKVGFPDTDFSAIQEDNWLAGGMWVRGSDSELSQTDYAFYTLLVLYPPFGPNYLLFEGGVYQMYEGLNPIGEDAWMKLLYYDSLLIPTSDTSTSFTLTATFDESTGLISWEASRSNQYTLQPYNIFADCPTICPHFVVGTYTFPNNPLLPFPPFSYPWIPYGKCYFFMFGASSKYEIGGGEWNVRVSDPSYLKDGFWNLVKTAKSIRGKAAYLDARFTAGGATYDDVNADHDFYFAKFYYPADSTLKDNTLLWGGLSSGSYGGEEVPIDTIGLIAPYIALTSIVAVGFVATNRKFGKFRKRNRVSN